VRLATWTFAGASRTIPDPAQIRLLIDPPAAGSWNMALDEALMENATAGRVTLRLYRWNPPALSFGRNQLALERYDPEAAGARGIDIVRRPTGGRSVYHDRELTYSVTAPAELWGGLRASYLRINRALEAGLAGLGVASAVVAEQSGRRAPPPGPRACFQDPLPGELAAAGRKLVGSAQWRDHGALLQHGSLLIHNDQDVVAQLRVGAGDQRSRAPVAAASLADVLPVPPDFDRLAEGLRAGFEAEFQVPVVEEETSGPELAAAGRLEARYESEAWTWRR